MVANLGQITVDLTYPVIEITYPAMDTEAIVKSLAESVTSFVDQTKDTILAVQDEIKELKGTVNTLADELKADRAAQKEAMKKVKEIKEFKKIRKEQLQERKLKKEAKGD